MMYLLIVSAMFGLITSDTQTQPVETQSDNHRGFITLNTTRTGLLLPAETLIKDYPLLLRFAGDQFPWSEARPDGSDIQIENDTHSVLPTSIEEWNPITKRGAIWVRLPHLRGDALQALTIKWGNVPRLTSPKSIVFDAANGYATVLHLDGQPVDVLANVSLRNDGVIPTIGAIGNGIRLRPGAGVSASINTAFTYPMGDQPSTTSAWLRIRKPNGTILGWGNEARQGKVVMQYRSPSHINMDCYFSDANVRSTSSIPLDTWIHIAHVTQKGKTGLYVNGRLEGSNSGQGAPLDIKEGARLWLGGWYGNYDFDGDIDEVRISTVPRTAAWIGLDADTQSANPMLTGRLVRNTDAPKVSTQPITVNEGQVLTLRAALGNADKATWELLRGTNVTVLGNNQSSLTVNAPRVEGTSRMTIRLRTVTGTSTAVENIPLVVEEAIRDPDVMIDAPSVWDGRTPAYVRADVREAAGSRFKWTVDGPGVAYEVSGNILRLNRGFKSGDIRIRVDVDNGGTVVSRSVPIKVTPPKVDPWVEPNPIPVSRLRDGAFIGRGPNTTGRIVLSGAISGGGIVELTATASDGRKQTTRSVPSTTGQFIIAIDVPARLVTYRLQAIQRVREKVKILADVNNVLCGDAFIIMGQSNAVATDFGPVTPEFTSPWIQTYTDRFLPARYRNADGQVGEIGYWGMELARKLLGSKRVPICLINGAIGGTRIDQHQRNAATPDAPETLYGRLLGRVANAGLQRGVRGIFWHQGENDQGADGPSGGFGHETYERLFVDLSHAWSIDYPNSRMTYMFQIWPKSCAMGVDGSDNVLRDVQRRLPNVMDRLVVMSTLGIDPPGGCHFPADGYAAMANLIYPLVMEHTYGSRSGKPNGAPTLISVTRTKQNRSSLNLQFDQPVVWSEQLRNEFLVDGKRGMITSGKVSGNALVLETSAPSGKSLSYLDSASWSQQRLLRGLNGIAALTFMDVTIH